MKIGVLKESEKENRVAILPEGVANLVKLKATLLVEKGAGIAAYADDQQYEEAGAKIVSRDDILKGADLIVGIQPLGKVDISKMGEGKVLIAALNPFFNQEMVRSLAKGNITSFSMELIPRTSRGQAMDILSSQATVAGYKAVLDAANHLPHFMPMFMSAAGTIKPAKVLILGAGVAGLQAIATTRKLGAQVEAFDVRSAVKEEVMSLGAKFVEVEGAKDDAAAGGYAVEQDEEFKKKQAQAIHDHAKKSDIVICTAQIFGRTAPILIKKETVEAMKPGSIVIDLAASTGGNCELTKNDEVVEHNQVRIIGKSDYPSDMPNDSSKMFGNNIINLLKLMIDEEGNLNLNWEDEIISGTCLTHDKAIKHVKVNEVIKD
jgi:NAD(P) transhydrogenase subunit alpha